MSESPLNEKPQPVISLTVYREMYEALRNVKQWLGPDLFTSEDVYQARCEQSCREIRAAMARAEQELT